MPETSAMPTTLPIPYRPGSRGLALLDRAKQEVSHRSPVTMIAGMAFVFSAVLGVAAQNADGIVSYLLICCMSALILVAAAVDEIEKRREAIRAWRRRLRARIERHRGSTWVMASCASVGLGLGLLTASELAGPLSARDAVAAAHGASRHTDPAFWQAQLVDALKVGDRASSCTPAPR
jgi:hypothetical protein